VPQDAFVFRGTVASNIAYGRPSATNTEIEAAARAVCADSVLASLPGGYAHRVEEAGNNLTAAQRQLIALARAWLAAPQILVLDEATSSLDAELESHVLAAIKKFGCTTIAVTHRQSVVAVADQVIVLDGGRVVQTGTPASMVKAGTAYDRLWNAVPEEPRPADVGSP
jgi:ATP-binding cassette subfamily B protein